MKPTNSARVVIIHAIQALPRTTAVYPRTQIGAIRCAGITRIIEGRVINITRARHVVGFRRLGKHEPRTVHCKLPLPLILTRALDLFLNLFRLLLRLTFINTTLLACNLALARALALAIALALFELLDEAILLLNKLARVSATLAIISTTRARRFTIIPGRGVAVSIIARLSGIVVNILSTHHVLFECAVPVEVLSAVYARTELSVLRQHIF
mmetsp:Transcript_108414/g.315240  ORF Transcript_108414/g.315240 Transcript_108414/m.315240 type:complete len:212 (-) Transcript_108414:259-894(-)